MPPSTQKKQRSSKLFQCSGYGDCKMVFTRGEHLARHKRKHTGEKPFPCIVPDCNKSFSRFDNMMQHTQTHRKDTQQSKLPQSQPYQQQYQHQSTITKSIQSSTEHSNKVILHQPLLTTNMPSAAQQPQYTANSDLPEGHIGSESPASLASASVMDSASSSDDDDDDDENTRYYHHHNEHTHWMNHPYRQLSVADMCNPIVAQQPLKIEQLTSDEVEAIQAFGKLRQATC